MTHAMTDLQKSVFDLLSNNAELTALIGLKAVHDHLIESENFPYISMGNATYADWSTSSDEGADLVLTIHIWDRALSRERTVEILELVHKILGSGDLELNDHRSVLHNIEFAEVRRELDSQDYHGLVRIRAKLEKLAA